MGSLFPCPKFAQNKKSCRSPKNSWEVLGILEQLLRIIQDFLRIIEELSRIIQDFLRIIEELSRIIQDFLRILEEFFRNC